jgi:hypothetical protein
MESQKKHVANRQPDKSSQYYPLVNKQFAIENCPVEIVDLPSYKMVDLSIVMLDETRG